MWFDRKKCRDDVDNDRGSVCGKIDDYDVRLIERGRLYLIAVYV